MRHLAFAAALFVLTGSTIAQQPTEPKKKTDLELLQGIWEIAGLESGGKAQPGPSYKGNTFTFAKDKATLKEGAFPSIEFTFTLDSTRTPKTNEPTAKGNTIHGIYKLDGDEPTLPVSPGGLRPPGEFSTKTGGDSETFILKRSLCERHTDKTFGFTADFPAKPTETKRDDTTSAGKVTTTIYAAHGDMDRLTYSLSVTPLPPARFDTREAREAREVEALDAMQKAILAEAEKGAKAKVESEGKFKQPGGVLAARDDDPAGTPNSKDKAMRVAPRRATGHTLTVTVGRGDETLNVGRF